MAKEYSIAKYWIFKLVKINDEYCWDICGTENSNIDDGTLIKSYFDEYHNGSTAPFKESDLD